MVNIRSRRRKLCRESRLVLYLEMKDAIEKVLGTGTASFSRASSGCLYWRRPGASAGVNVPRHRKGLLVESSDTNALSKNTGRRQEEIDLRWNGMENGCLRAFFFNSNCNDEMGIGNGAPTDISYVSTVRYWPQGTMRRGLAADFNGTTSKVNIGSAADIDSLTELTIALWTYVRGPGEGNRGKIFYKAYNSGATMFECNNESGGYVGLYGSIRCATTNAESLKYCLSKNGWHHVAFTYSDSGDRKIHIFVDGVEVTGYSYQTAGVGARISDAADTAYIGNMDDGIRTFDGLISTCLLYNRILSSAEIKWLAHDHYHGAGGDLRPSMWEKQGKVDPAKISHGMVCFCFDDAYVAQYTAAKPVFDSHGVKGSLAIISNNIGASGRLSAAQLQAFIASGWGIESHSKTHADHVGLTEEQLRAEFADSKAALEALGATVDHYCWPSGAPQEEYRAVCAEYYKSARGSGLLQDENNLFTLLSYVIDTPGAGAIATYKTYIDEAYTLNRVLNFCMHDVDADDVTTLTELIEYAQSKGMPILTRAQAFANLTFTPPEPIYEAFSTRCQNVSASPRQLYQIRTLTAEDYVVSFLAYTNGGAVTSGDVVPFADTAFTNEITEFHYEHLGGGVYLCWGKFAASSGSWNVGLEVKGNKTVYVSLPTCVRAGTSMASGPYPRSLIANLTTGAAIREADSLTVSGGECFHPNEGTMDIEFYPLYPSDLSDSFQFYFAHLYGGSGQVSLYRDDANTIRFRIQANGDDDSVSGTISWNRGDRVKIRVVWDCEEKLDGTNYMLMYGRVNDGAWTQIGASAGQPTAPSSEQSLYVGRAGDSSGYEANSFTSWLRVYDRPLLNPAW